jgi:hypothetical protein
MTNQNLIQRVVGETLIAATFRRVKNMYYKSGTLAVVAVHLLRSRFGPLYHLDLYANFLAIDSNPYPGQAAHLQLRADRLLELYGCSRGELSGVFSLGDPMSDSQREADIRRVMGNLVVAIDDFLSVTDLRDPISRRFVDLALARGSAQDYLASNHVPWRESTLHNNVE